jgi:hypothetical protein
MALFVLIALAIGFARQGGWLPVRPFNQDLWKQYQTSNDIYEGYVRLHMIEHLVRSGRLDGLTRTEVVALLGAPDAAGAGHFPDWDLVYMLGPTRGMPMDHEWLGVRFGPSGTTSEYRVLYD